MATKKPTFRELYGTWSAQEARRDQDRTDPRNRADQGAAILNSMIAEGANISDEQFDTLLQQYMNTGEFDFAEGQPSSESAPVLPATADERPMPQMSAVSAESVFDQLTTDPVQAVRDMGARFRASARSGLAGLITSPADLVNASINSPANVALADRLGVVLPQVRNPKMILDEAARLRQEAAAIRREEVSARSKLGEDVLGEAEGFTGTIGALVRNLTLLADQAAEQAGQLYSSLPGAVAGPTGMVAAQGAAAAGQQGEDAYQTVLARGGSEEEAQAARNIASGISFVANTAIPSITPKGTALEELISGAAERATSRSVVRGAVAPLAGESVAEAFTEALDQGGLNVATGEDFTAGLGKAAALGAVLGAGMGVGPAAVDARNILEDRAARRAELEETILQGAESARAEPAPEPTSLEGVRQAGRQRTEAAAETVDRELYYAEQEAARRQSLEDAFAAREQEAAAQRELEQEAGFRTIERDAKAPKDRVERYADVIERTPIQPAAEITPEQIAAERAQAAELEAQSKRVAGINKVAARRKALADQAAKKQTAEEKKQQAAEASLRTRATDSLLAEGMDDAQVFDALPARITKLREEALAKKQAEAAKPAAKPAAKKGQAKPAVSKPARKPAAAKPAAKAAPDIAKLKASSNPLDRAQAEVLERLGQAGRNKQATPKDFGEKVKRISTALAGDASRRGAAVENLIRQGKVVVVPNAEHTGRAKTTRAGEYDVDSGTTYIYTDNLSDNVHADIMEATAHETGHLGQFNQRDQRPEMLKALLGNKTTSEGAKKLRAAAAGGNKFAQEALQDAEKDTKARRDAGEENPSRYEDAELVAYAIGAENRARTSTLGQAGGALRDAVAGAKAQLRKRLGLDLDVSLGDLRSAMGRVLEEGVETDTSATADTGERLGMIAGRNAVNAARAKAEGKMYQIPGHPESQPRWEFPDYEAELVPSTIEQGLSQVREGKPVSTKLPVILKHDRLFEEYPILKQYKIIVDNLPGTSMGRFDRGNKNITIDAKLLRKAIVDPNEISTLSETGLTNYEFARNVVLHEIQHAVQNIEGFAGGASYNKASVDKARNARNDAMQEYNDYITMWSETLPDVVDTLPEEARAIWEDILEDNPKLSPVGEARLFLEYGVGEHSTVSRYRTSARRFPNIDAKKNAAHKAYVDAKENADRTYYDVHGEVEARNTETRSRMTPEELELSPPVETYDTPVEQTLPDRGENVIFREGTESRGERLGMAAPRDRSSRTAFRNRNRFTTAIMAGLRNDKGLGTHIRNEVELAKAAPVEFEAKANRAAGKYDEAIKSLAKAKGVTPAELNAEIRGKLEEIADMEGSAGDYAAAFNAIAGQYGKAGAALKELRGLVDDLSTEFIRTYLDSGVKLTNKEKDDIRKVAANLGRYVHRFYASRLGRGLGKQYADAVQKAVDEAKEKGVKSLSPEQKELYGRYAGAAKAILDGVMIPSEDDIVKLQDSHVDYLYDTWIGTDPTGVTREEKEEALLDIRDEIGADELQQKVEAAAQALLHGVREHAASRFYDRGEKLNTTIMQKRSHIPKEIRALMGEVTDPAGALVNTISKQAEYVARTKLMLALRNMASTQDLQPPGSAGNAAVRANNMTELTGEGFGPLQGWYASPAMKAMIGDTAESLMNFTEAMTTNSRNGEAAIENLARGTARVWMKGAAAAKTRNIVGNVYRFPLNFAGSFAMLSANGNFNVKSYARGLQDATAIIRYAAKPSAGLGSAELASKYRVVDSATVGDLKNLDLGKIEQVVREMSGKSPGAFMRKARELGMAGRELYAMMDVWSKIANFHAEADFLKSLYKQDGQSKTDDEIYREASAIVNNTNMSYARTMPIFKALERGGITQYGPYLYEAHRVVFANAYQALHEMYQAKNMNTPAAAARMAFRGLTRLAGLSGTLAMIGALSHFFAGTFGDDEEDKRALLPEFARVMDFMKVGVDADGKPILYAVSNVDPLGPITDLYRAARLGEQPLEAVWDQFKENYIAPSLGGAVYDAFSRTTGLTEPTSARPRKPLMQQWWPNGWSAVTGATGGEDEWASVAHLLETRYLPGTMRAWSDSNPIAAGGSMDEVAYNTARGLGARGLRYDPKVGVQDAAFNYDDTMKAIRRDLAAYLETTTNPTAEELTSRLLSARQDEKKAWDQLYKTRKGLLSLDVDEDEIAGMFKEARVPKEVISQLMDDEFYSRAISESSIEAAEAAEVRRAKTQADKDRVRAKWERAYEVIEMVQGEE